MNLKEMFKTYRWKFLLTLILILLEAGLLILFPLIIGYAVDDVLVELYRGPFLLGALGAATLLVGAGRRFYDSRFYAKIYQEYGVSVGMKQNEPTSTKSAHLGFLGEVVAFFEDVLPEVVSNSIGLIGTLVIIATMDVRIFFGCLLILGIVIMVYGLSMKRTIRFNSLYNDEQERQVATLSDQSPILLRRHLQKMMKWNIRLSDLETMNFSIIWMAMMAFLVSSIIRSVGAGSISYGTVFALILYLFQFIESMTVMPLYYQQGLRLKEIVNRLRVI